MASDNGDDILKKLVDEVSQNLDDELLAVGSDHALYEKWISLPPAVRQSLIDKARIKVTGILRRSENKNPQTLRFRARLALHVFVSRSALGRRTGRAKEKVTKPGSKLSRMSLEPTVFEEEDEAVGHND